MIDLKFLGTGGATNIELGNNSAYIKRDRCLLLIDASESSTEKLVSLGVLNEKLDEVVIFITHTHADHIGGLGTLIWYCNFELNIKPKIFSNSESHENTISSILTLLGVKNKHYEFTNDNYLPTPNIHIEAIKTTHTPELECYSLRIKDDEEEIFYTGDTNDIDLVKRMAKDKNISKIYCEISTDNYPAHIYYEDLKDIEEKEKFVLMHFNSMEAYKKIKNENIFNLAEETLS